MKICKFMTIIFVAFFTSIHAQPANNNTAEYIALFSFDKHSGSNGYHSQKPDAKMMNEVAGLTGSYSKDRVMAFRLRSDFHIELDEDLGWAAAVNEAPSQTVDSPFRIRFEVESGAAGDRRQYSLQYRWNDEPWVYMEAQEFPYPSEASPPASIVGCDGFFYGEEADDLIAVSDLPAAPGAGICLAPTTPGWSPDAEAGASAEWEWAIVVRRWADGHELVRDGDRFALRMVDQKGLPLSGPVPEFTVHVPARHLGGTFVETPARIGPWENSRGELYFIMEPTETDNVFMMVKSSDGGQSWFEVAPDNRPQADDLEGVGSILSEDGIIHIVHQTSDAVFYHAFATTDHPGVSDRWVVVDQVIASPEEPPTQVADITLRPDGSLVVLYGAGDRLHISICKPDGAWDSTTPLDPENPNGLTNPSLVCRPDGIVDIAYKSTDGKGWSRQLRPDNTFTVPEMFADDLGTTESETMAILPLVYLPATETTVAVFRRSDGFLYQSRKSQNNEWSKLSRVSDRPVVTNAVDSDQAGADVVAFGTQLWIAFIAQQDRDIYLSVPDGSEHKPAAERIVSDIDGCWVRGQILNHQPDSPVYGLVYDAGSKGGSGYNKFISHPIR